MGLGAGPAVSAHQMRTMMARVGHHNVESITPPLSEGIRMIDSVRKNFRKKTPKGYTDAWVTFLRKMESMHARNLLKDIATSGDEQDIGKACAFMMGSCFATRLPNKQFLRELSDNLPEDFKSTRSSLGPHTLTQLRTHMDMWGVPLSGDSYAAILNWALVEGNMTGAKQVLDHVTEKDNRHLMTPRMEGLILRKPALLVKERAVVLKKAVEFGRNLEAWSLFQKLVRRELVSKAHYTTMIWACKDHANQLEFLERIKEAGDGRGWESDPEVFNAQFWFLQKEDRYDDMHNLVERMLQEQVNPDNRTMYALRRAGERKLRQRRLAAEDRHSWEVVGGLGQRAVRKRVGL